MTAEEIKARLKEKGLTQAALATRFGVSTPTISYLIHGEMVSARLERRLARALGVSVDVLRAKLAQPPMQQ